MAIFRHGIYGREIPTKVVPPILADIGIPVIIGTAPIHTAINPGGTNAPKLIYSYEEAVRTFGYSDDWDKYTISEFIYSQFALYGMAPCVIINVFDPATHKTVEKTEEIRIIDGKFTLAGEDIIADSVKVTTKTDNKVLKIVEDYVLSYNNSNQLIVTAVSALAENVDLSVKYSSGDPAKVTKADIIGGIDVATGAKRGAELVSEVYPRFRLIPGSILAPKFSSDSEVAAILETKARKINGVFDAIALIDAPISGEQAVYNNIPAWKNKNNITETGQVVGWPKVKLGSRVFHFSTHLAGLIQKTDAAWGMIPYKSPSNESMKIDSLVSANGEVFLGLNEANYLNGQGIMTAINFNGWRSWGNRTAIYPTSSDVKDVFIPIRRMFDWIMNTFVLTFWSKVDNPLNKRLVETVIDSANLWLNGLTAQGALYGGRLAFLAEENPVTDIMDGKLRIHVYLTPPSPAEEIEFVKEYDVEYVKAFIEDMAS